MSLENWRSEGHGEVYVTMTLTFDQFTPLAKIYERHPFFILYLTPMYMKSLGWEVLELSDYNKVRTDRHTDRQTKWLS